MLAVALVSECIGSDSAGIRRSLPAQSTSVR